MLTKRQFLLGGTALVASTLGGAWLTPAMANEVTLLNDILHGVSDALVREYIRENYRHDGRWDGRHWIVGTHRYSPAQYRVYLEGRYRDHKAHKEHPEHPHGRDKQRSFARTTMALMSVPEKDHTNTMIVINPCK